MDSSAKYTFRAVDGTLRHQPRTKNDLSHQAWFKEAEGAAQDLNDEVWGCYHDLMSLDQSDFDLNDKDGEVLVEDYHHPDGSMISGSSFQRANSGWPASQVLRAEKRIGSETARLEMELGSLQDDICSATRNSGGVVERLSTGSYIREGVTQYTVSARRDATSPTARLAHGPYARDEFPRNRARSVEKSTGLGIDDRTGQIEYRPRRVEDLKQARYYQEIAKAGNDSMEAVKTVLEEFLLLDGSEVDQNPRPGEVLLENQPLGERVVSGFLSEFQVKDGNTEERDFGGTFPYLQAQAGEETFQAFLTKDSDYSSYDHRIKHAGHHSDAIYVHDDGKKAVHVVMDGLSAKVVVESGRPSQNPNYHSLTT